MLVQDGSPSGAGWENDTEPSPTHADPYEDWQEEEEGLGEYEERPPGLSWRVAPNFQGRSLDLSEEEVHELRCEELAARLAQVPWQERGPAHLGTTYDVSHWRGQTWRQGINGGVQRRSA